MATTPRSNRRLQYRDSTTTAATPGSLKRRLDGLYENGEWWCNCDPREDAKYFTVKKKGRNHGRGFYTCGSRRCKFFLWEEDAEVRQAGGGGGSTPRSKPAPPITWPENRQTAEKKQQQQKLDSLFVGTSSDDDDHEGLGAHIGSPGTIGRSQLEMPSTPCPPGNKRKRVDFEEDLFGELGTDEEAALLEAADRSSEKPRQNLAQAANFTTPTNNRRTRDALAAATMPTPSVTRNLFPGAEAKRQRAEADSEQVVVNGAGLQTPAITPHRSRLVVDNITPKHDLDDYDLTGDIMTLLKGQKLDEPIAQAVRASLNKYVLKTRGIVRGRDLVRSTLKAKDDKIAELQDRVVALENKNKQQQESIAAFKASIMELYTKH